MWTKFLCWWLGHDIVSKAFNGKTKRVQSSDEYGYETEHDIMYYHWVKHKYCLRCGQNVNEDKETN